MTQFHSIQANGNCQKGEGGTWLYNEISKSSQSYAVNYLYSKLFSKGKAKNSFHYQIC